MNIKKLAAGGMLAATLVSAAGISSFVAFANDNKENKDNKEKSYVEELKRTGAGPEVQIKTNGSDLIRGAKVTGVSGNSFSANVTWGLATLTAMVNTDGTTEFIRKYGGKSSLAEFTVGDIVSFQGTVNTSVNSPITVQAKAVKNWSIQKKNASFTGTVQSTDVGSQTFVLTAKEKEGLTLLQSLLPSKSYRSPGDQSLKCRAEFCRRFF